MDYNIFSPLLIARTWRFHRVLLWVFLEFPMLNLLPFEWLCVTYGWLSSSKCVLPGFADSNQVFFWAIPSFT